MHAQVPKSTHTTWHLMLNTNVSLAQSDFKNFHTISLKKTIYTSAIYNIYTKCYLQHAQVSEGLEKC